MKKLIIKIAILILIIIFLPYIITIFFSNTKENSIDFITKDGIESTQNGSIDTEKEDSTDSSKEGSVESTDEGSVESTEEGYINLEIEDPTIIYKENGEATTLNLDNYIIGAVAANIPIDYELETLKAQAVIIRTYVLKAIEYLKTKGNEEPTTDDIGLSYTKIEDMKETWGEENYDSNYEKIENAVYSTKNEVITYDNELIEPIFHEVSVGKTRSALEAWGEDRPYLTSVDSSEDVTSTDYMKITEDSVKNVISIIKKTYDNVSISNKEFFDKVVVTSRDSLGFVKNISVGSLNLTGEEFACMMKLNSSNFYIENYEGKVRFICKGKGHGVGLSEFGANVMAKKGSTYKELLNYYYAKTDVVVYKSE